MPNRSRNGAESRPDLVVAPIRVNGLRFSNGTRRRTLADNNIDMIILHRWIENLLHHPVETVDLIDKEHVEFIKTRKDSRQIPGVRVPDRMFRGS